MKEDGEWGMGGGDRSGEVMKRAREHAGGRGEGRVSGDTVVSSTGVFVGLLTMSLYLVDVHGPILLQTTAILWWTVLHQSEL